MCTRAAIKIKTITRAFKNSKNVLNEEQCQEIVKKKLQRDLMTDFSFVSHEIITTEYASDRMGRYFTLKTTVVNNKSPTDKKTIDFFIKLQAPRNTIAYQLDQEGQIFRKEVDLYTTVFPKIFDGLKNYTIIPKCYLGYYDKLLVLEDMRPMGYEIKDILSPMDLDHCTIVMKALAEFHAQSIIYEATNKGNIGEEFSYCLYDAFYPTGKNTCIEIMNAMIKGIFGIIDLIEDLNECGKKKLKEKFQSWGDDSSLLSPSEKFKNVLCHGNLDTDNILFKYNSENKPIDCCFIDYQSAKYNTPAHDIWSFLQFATKREFRDDHADELFKIYHENLTTVLTKAGLDCETVLSWKDFKESLSETHTMYMTHRTVYSSFTYAKLLAKAEFDSRSEEEQMALTFRDRTPFVCDLFHNSNIYREKMTDSLVELHDNICADCSD